ncbi:hypothetical protein [Hahella ganghwensis]|uniref:hypothetical protein n=1 Tax=Hahella ganghwensis TaxID=286420 RepID=UPI00037352D9|nr:hypothetical protein [Hahella ganghwensis]
MDYLTLNHPSYGLCIITRPLVDTFEHLQQLLFGPGNPFNAHGFVMGLETEQSHQVYRLLYGLLHFPGRDWGAGADPRSIHRIDELADALTRGSLKVYRHQAPVISDADTRAEQAIREQIDRTLKDIIQIEKAEAQAIEQKHGQRNSLEKAAAYAKAFGVGLGNAVWSMMSFVKETYDVASPRLRMQRLLKAAVTAGWAADNPESWYEIFQRNYREAEKKELVEAIGFDPTKITPEMLNEAFDIAAVIWEDESLHRKLVDFVEGYIRAQHALELTEMSGGAAFELILGAVLTFLTGGAAIIAITASKARYIRILNKLGEYFVDLGRRLAKRKKRVKPEHRLFRRTGKPSSSATTEPSKPKPPPIKIKEEAPKRKPNTPEKATDSKAPTSKPVSSIKEAEARLKRAREAIEERKAAGLPPYQPKYSDDQLLEMVATGATANERFLVSIQPKNTNPDAKLSYQRDSGLVPTWTTSFDQLEAADSDPKLIHQVLGAESNFDPSKDYVMHIVDRGENLENFGQNTIVPSWDNLADASVRELGGIHEPDIIRQTMNSEYQAEYANKMQEFWDAGGNEFDSEQILEFSDKMNIDEEKLFSARHNIRTEIGANSEFTGNGLTANTAAGGGKYGVVETLSLERHLPKLSELQDDNIVKTLDLTPL